MHNTKCDNLKLKAMRNKLEADVKQTNDFEWPDKTIHKRCRK